MNDIHNAVTNPKGVSNIVQRRFTSHVDTRVVILGKVPASWISIEAS